MYVSRYVGHNLNCLFGGLDTSHIQTIFTTCMEKRGDVIILYWELGRYCKNFKTRGGRGGRVFLPCK